MIQTPSDRKSSEVKQLLADTHTHSVTPHRFIGAYLLSPILFNIYDRATAPPFPNSP
ncbi:MULTISPECIES: hypothetical protein [unclassified Microcoleus]|uniref:hypothetical protein n=1 Tax=unclassified Microcoleus TaxID=2642155 RepID=UPI0025ED2950|nr:MULTISPECIES: hypothetical protein [unclassified Microcoleus]